MDQKRFLITFLLIMVVFLGINYFLRPARKPQPEAPVTDTAVVTQEMEEPTESADAGFTPLVEEDPIIVETPLYIAEFSRKGGLLISYRLKDYKGNNGGLVDLVPEGTGLFDFSTGDLFGRDLRFEPDVDSIVLEEGEEGELNLVWTQDTLTAVKRFGFDGSSYYFSFALEGLEEREVLLRFDSGLAVTEEKRAKDDRSHFNFLVFEEGLTKKDLGKLKKDPYSEGLSNPQWMGMKTKYFLLSLIPTQGTLTSARARRWERDGDEGIGFQTALSGENTFRVYLGPIDYFILKDSGCRLDSVCDFGFSIIAPLSKLILRFFRLLYTALPNYGVVIILFSLLMKIIFWPLSIRSLRSMRRMQELKPKMDALKKMYDDPKQQQQEMMELYRKHKVNPFAGCLPLLIQLPVFWALWSTLRTSIELRGAPFFLWINDLSQPDLLFSLAGFPIRFLPLAMAAASVFQARMNPAGDQQSKYFAYFLPLIFTVIFWNFPAGMVLYWLCYNLYGILEQLWLRRTHK
jgi:YidC/Oxa1 family membrane protein insertase